MVEAKEIHCALQPLINSLGDEPSSEDLIGAFNHSYAMHALFVNDTIDFYAVTVDAPPGIHCTRLINRSQCLVTSS